jgi:hypothetical protein
MCGRRRIQTHALLLVMDRRKTRRRAFALPVVRPQPPARARSKVNLRIIVVLAGGALSGGGSGGDLTDDRAEQEVVAVELAAGGVRYNAGLTRQHLQRASQVGHVVARAAGGSVRLPIESRSVHLLLLLLLLQRTQQQPTALRRWQRRLWRHICVVQWSRSLPLPLPPLPPTVATLLRRSLVEPLWEQFCSSCNNEDNNYRYVL